MNYIAKIESRVSGIPCLVGVISVARFVPATFHHESEGGEVEFDVLDRRGYRAKWLERKLTDADNDRIYEEIMKG